MKKKLLSIAIFIFSFQSLAFCQADTSVLSKALTKLKTLLTDHIIEKAYLHFDKPYPYYTAGDRIYFKAYVTMGELHEPSTISGVLHVDLISKSNVLIKSINLQLNNGIAWGDFTLPDTLQQGSYRIRAYTEWMRNYNDAYFFNQDIAVSSLNNISGNTQAQQIAAPNLQFFPEGGNLVSDIHTRLAFKAIGSDGLGINFKGSIEDNNGKAVGEIVSGHLGMGVTDFTPETGKSYKAKVVFADGSQNTVSLPAVELQGITLSVNTDDTTKVSILIKANAAYYKENQNKQLNLIVYWAGAVRTAKIKLSNPTLGLELPASTFRTGVLQVTLLSETGEPLSERLAFIQNQDLLRLSVTANKPSLAKQENVELNMNVKNADGSPASGFLSASVIDESKLSVNDDCENTILSYLLLSADLTGYIEQPNYYFAHINKQTRTNLDVLMLTQGYRRFIWKQLINNSFPPITYQPEKGLGLTGKVEDQLNKPVVNETISLLQMSGGQPLSDITDDKGMFRFQGLNFTDTAHFILKVTNKKVCNTARISYFNDGFRASVTPSDQQQNILDAANADMGKYIKSDTAQQRRLTNYWQGKSIAPKEKVINEKRNEDNYNAASVNGTGNASQVLHSKDLGKGPLIQSLNGQLRDVRFVNDLPYLPVSFSQTLSYSGAVVPPMLVIIDGVKHGDINTLMAQDVESVEVLKNENESIYGVEGVGGVLIINTKRGKGEIAKNEVSTTGVLPIAQIGFYKAREFYRPKYNPATANKPQGEQSTIFWKPDIATDVNGNASFSYPNADRAGTYDVIIEGIDSKGNLGRLVYKYELK